jgi:hypothetical protein
VKPGALKLAGAVAAVTALSLLILFARTNPNGDPTDTSLAGLTNPTVTPRGSKTTTDSATSPGDPPPPGSSPAVGHRRLEPIARGETADLGGDVLATVTGVTPVELEGQGPGTTAGPGAEVTIELRNGSTEPFDLLGVAVTATYGEGTPAVPVPQASGPAFRGVIRPGTTTTGHYAFRLPAEAVPTLVVELTSASSPNVITVRPSEEAEPMVR